MLLAATEIKCEDKHWLASLYIRWFNGITVPNRDVPVLTKVNDRLIFLRFLYLVNGMYGLTSTATSKIISL